MIEPLTGLLIAFAISITGVGAGTVTAPVLILFMGLEPSVAVGTALVFSMIVKVPAGISYLMRKKVDFKYLALMSAGGIPGIIAGTILLRYLSGDKQVKVIVLSVVGAIVVFSALLNLLLMVRNVDVSSKADKLEKIIPIATFFIGIEVGFSSAGAGALGTILLLITTRLFACTVVGTDIVFGLILSAVGGGIHIGMGNLDYPMLFKLVGGGVAGAMLGSWAAAKVPGKPFRYALLVWLLFIGSQLLYRGLQGG